MIKLPENKTRKKLRITQCVLFLILIALCTFPFIQGKDSQGVMYYRTVFDMLAYIGGKVPDTAAGSAFQSYIIFYLVFPIIPLIGFLFCAFDKERNVKNIVAYICSLLGVVAILFIVTLNHIEVGSILSLLIYILISFLTTIAMFARITSDDDDNKKSK